MAFDAIFVGVLTDKKSWDVSGIHYANDGFQGTSQLKKE